MTNACWPHESERIPPLQSSRYKRCGKNTIVGEETAMARRNQIVAECEILDHNQPRLQEEPFAEYALQYASTCACAPSDQGVACNENA